LRAARVLLGVLILLAIALLVSSLYQAISSDRDAHTFPAPGRLVDVGGYRLHLLCTGQVNAGSSTVVFEGGLGAISILWSMVQKGVAPYARVCSYDRAGYGWSDNGPLPRTAGQIAIELHRLLQNAGERPPYLLVGHSLGGLIIRR
jgi:pimeloyl-ACP methyl ester carboxylesterase